MLNSQITLSARNIPTYAATTIRTREPRQVMTEDALLAGWPDDAKAYRDRAAKTHPHTGRKMGSAKPGEGINEQVLAILSPTEWKSVTQIRDALGFGYNKARNALDRLVTRRDVDRRIVENADGLRNRTFYRINAKSASRRKRDAAMLDYMSEPRGVSDLAAFSGLSPQRVSFMLGEWFEQGLVEREWTPGAKGRGTHLWKRKEGGE
jgi:predicted ArsR family transcriptional regulator